MERNNYYNTYYVYSIIYKKNINVYFKLIELYNHIESISITVSVLAIVLVLYYIKHYIILLNLNIKFKIFFYIKRIIFFAYFDFYV